MSRLFNDLAVHPELFMDERERTFQQARTIRRMLRTSWRRERDAQIVLEVKRQHVVFDLKIPVTLIETVEAMRPGAAKVSLKGFGHGIEQSPVRAGRDSKLPHGPSGGVRVESQKPCPENQALSSGFSGSSRNERTES